MTENPHELVVYGSIGRTARIWEDFDQIIASLQELESDQTLLVQFGKPVGVFRTYSDVPRVLIANSNLVPHWAAWDHFNELDKKERHANAGYPDALACAREKSLNLLAILR